MTDKRQQQRKKAPVKKEKEKFPIRRVTTVLGIVTVLLLTLVVYKQFGIGDAWRWVEDVLILILLMSLIFLAAVFVVWLLMLYRKHRNKT